MNRAEARQYFRNLADNHRIGEYRVRTDPEERQIRRGLLEINQRTERARFREAQNVLIGHAVQRRAARVAEERAIKPAPEQVRPETKSQETIRWAHEVLDEFASVPQGTKHDRKGVEEFVGTAVKDLWKDPERFEVAVGVWKAQRETSRFYDRAVDQVAKDAGKHWHEVEPGQLVDYVRMYARKGFASEDAGNVLKGYFQGPQLMTGRVNAFYKYVDGLLDATEDIETVREGTRIAYFDTEILPLGGPFFLDLYIAQTAGMYDPDLHSKALNAGTTVISTLARYSGLDQDRLRDQVSNTFIRIGRKPPAQARIQMMLAESMRRDPVRYRQLTEQFIPQGLAAMRGEPSASGLYKRLMDGDPESEAAMVALGNAMEPTHNDPIVAKYLQKLLYRSNGALHKRYIADKLREEGEETTSITIRLPGTRGVIDIYVPSSIKNRREEIVEEYLTQQGVFNELNENRPIIYDTWQLEDKTVHGVFRFTDESEAQRHQIEGLNAFGFPVVHSENLQAENAALATKIELEQRRFLNTRGIRVPFQHPALTELGYQYVDFKQDQDNPEETSVTIAVKDIKYNIKLDRDFRFDFEGRPLDFSAIGDSVHNVLLTLLYPALCGTHVEDDHGETIEINKLFTTRIGYIGFLGLKPNGEPKNFTEKQAEYFFRDRGRDLMTASERRKVDGEIRNSSYWRPVVKDDPTLPPVRLNLELADDKFSAVEGEPVAVDVVTAQEPNPTEVRAVPVFDPEAHRARVEAQRKRSQANRKRRKN